MDLFTLSAKLTVDSGAFTKGLNDAEKAGSNLSSKLDKITSVAKKVAGALVFKKAISSLKSLADKAGQAGDKIDKASQKVGLSRTAYQEWAYILDKCGGNIDSLGTALKTMNNKIETGSDAVGKLGLKFEDLQKMSIEDRFNAVVKALQDMPDGAEKSALALELFGKQGQELMPLLNSSAEEVEALRQRFHDLGIELTDEQINAAAKYQDTLSDLMQVFDGIKILVGSELLPVVTEWADKMAMYAGKLLKAYKEDGGLSGVFKVLNQDITTLTANLKNSGNPVLETLGAIIDGIWNGLQIAVGLFTDFEGTVQSMKESDSLGVRLLGNAIEAVGKALDWIVKNENIVVPALGAIIAAFAVGKVVAFVAALNPVSVVLAAIALAAVAVAANWEKVKTAAVNAWNAIKDWAGKTFKTTIEWIQTGWAVISGAIQDAREWVGKVFKTTVEWVQKAWAAVGSAFQDAMDWVGKAFKVTIEWVRKAWAAVSSAFTTAGKWADKAFKTTIEWVISAWDTISSAFDTATSWIDKTFKTTIEWVRNAWDDVNTAFNTAASWVGNTYKVTVEWVENAWDAISSAFDTAAEWVGNTFKVTIDFVKQGFDAVKDAIAAIPRFITTVVSIIHKDDGGGGGHGFAKGLPTVPYDNFPAVLHRNETVLTASQSRQLRDNGTLFGTGKGLSGDGTGSLGDLAAMIVDAIKEGMANAQVNSYLDGKRLTDEVSRIMGGDITSRRFA